MGGFLITIVGVFAFLAENGCAQVSLNHLIIVFYIFVFFSNNITKQQLWNIPHLREKQLRFRF